MCLVLFDLLLNFLADLLVLTHFLNSSIFEFIDLLLDRAHTLLKLLRKVLAQLLLILEHRLVLQVQVVILLEDGFAEGFESLPLLDTLL